MSELSLNSCGHWATEASVRVAYPMQRVGEVAVFTDVHADDAEFTSTLPYRHRRTEQHCPAGPLSS